MTKRKYDNYNYNLPFILGLIAVGSSIMFVSGTAAAYAATADVEGNTVEYTIKKGTVLDVSFDSDFVELIFTISPTGDDEGTLDVTIPRSLLDSKLPSGQGDDVFFVIVNEFDVDYEDIGSDSATSRMLSIPFTMDDTSITIIGTTSGAALNQIAEESTQPPATDDDDDDTATVKIPSWIKSNAQLWSDGLIDDGTFVAGLKFLIDDGIIVIPPTEAGVATNAEIPSWIKFNAGLWSSGQIDDGTFVSGIQFLISNGIMVIIE